MQEDNKTLDIDEYIHVQHEDTDYDTEVTDDNTYEDCNVTDSVQDNVANKEEDNKTLYFVYGSDNIMPSYSSDFENCKKYIDDCVHDLLGNYITFIIDREDKEENNSYKIYIYARQPNDISMCRHIIADFTIVGCDMLRT